MFQQTVVTTTLTGTLYRTSVSSITAVRDMCAVLSVVATVSIDMCVTSTLEVCSGSDAVTW
jgi:NhaP-type Na+/H+ and K+/H+ antiporter